MNAERDLARQWLAQAQNDLLNADNNLRSEVIPYDTVCFRGRRGGNWEKGGARGRVFAYNGWLHVRLTQRQENGYAKISDARSDAVTEGR